MTSARGRLLVLFCGMCSQMNGCLMTNDTQSFKKREMPSWIDAYNQPPNISYQLISPFLALEVVSQLQNLTAGPIYVNGFTYGTLGEGVVVQSANPARKFDVYCQDKHGSYVKDDGQYTYKEGKDYCQHNKSRPYFLNFTTVKNPGPSFSKTVFWSEEVNVNTLVSGNVTIHCMVLDLEGDGRLMLETNCNRNHTAVYVKDKYKQTIKQYISSSDYPVYNPDGGGSTFKGTDATSSSPFNTDKNPYNTDNNSYNPSTKHHDNVQTNSPGTNILDIEQSTSKSKVIGGMNPDIFFTLVAVGSVVVVFGIIIICCCFRKRKNGTRGRPALSDDYSNPVDSIGVKDEDIESNPNNGVYASPQDSITLVKAKKRDSIDEGVYDVTFTSGQRKPSVDPNIQCANAYAHVTIQQKGGAAPSDDTENHYDSTSYMKPKQTVLVSSSHSDHTYGEVKIKTET